MDIGLFPPLSSSQESHSKAALIITHLNNTSGFQGQSPIHHRKSGTFHLDDVMVWPFYLWKTERKTGKERARERGKDWDYEGEKCWGSHEKVWYCVPTLLVGNHHVMKLLMFRGMYRPDIPWLPNPESSPTCFAFVGLHKRNTGNMWRVINFLPLLLSCFV